ncbi:MAG TPA: hypothetical protein VFL73_12405 [Solirubrobacteraceae bacterium]|nr:hypothetical protein [Solirubrobacteraceae bacterium]
MRPVQQRLEAEALLAAGVSLSETSRRTGIPFSTLRGWKTGRIRPLPEPVFADPPPDAYAYLLGAYLGDGDITRGRRNVYRLTISLDKQHGEIVNRCAVTMHDVMPMSRVLVQPHPRHRLTRVSAYSKRWPQLFPQHGPGRKHERRIALDRWQRDIVEAEPRQFIRGLIETDGCRATNTIRHAKRTYRYPRYQFSNKSQDIKDLFGWACDLVGVEWRVMNSMNISVARRESVALLDEFVGPKR